ncbi:MAG: hypothetical protein HZA53_01655 [Planctomycetes bacterium]|nr:hypothetical protein [Planctomycetota bacterium]
MQRFSIVAACAALFVCSSASNPAPVLCGSGAVDGVWDLPLTSGGNGQLTGLLFVGSTATVAYTFTATLTDVPTPCLSCIEGEVDGVLDDGIGPGPDFLVRGHYRGLFLNGTGQYWAQVLTPTGAHVAGRIGGTFSDPLALPGPGTFDGRWRVCR